MRYPFGAQVVYCQVLVNKVRLIGRMRLARDRQRLHTQISKDNAYRYS